MSKIKQVSIWRAILIAIPLIIPNTYFATQRGVTWAAPPSTLSLIYNAIFTMLVLTILNVPFKKLTPKYALTQQELLIIYIMISVSTAIAGHDEIEIVASIMPHAFQFATPENDWANVFWKYIPDWLSVSNQKALANRSTGESSIYNIVNLKPWIQPAIWWSLFFVDVVFVGFCINTMLRKQWIEHEKLSYPIVRLPYEMSLGGGSSSFFGNKLMWGGFCIAGGMDIINGLNHFWPQIPEIPIRTMEIGHYFTQKPWNAMGWTPLCLFPFVIGLAFFIPKNLSLSLWVFYLFWKAQKVVFGAMGKYYVLNPFTVYFDAESLGAFLSIFIFAIYSARRHLGSVLRKALGLSNLDDSNEPLGYRFAFFGVLVGTGLMITFWYMAGMSLWLSILLISLYIITITIVARIRAELGPPSHDLYSFSQAIVGFVGTSRLGPQNITVTAIFRGIDRMYRGHPMPHELEAMKLCERTQIPYRKLFPVIMITAVIAGPVAFWAWLDLTYRYGNYTGAAYGGETFFIAQRWLNETQGSDSQAIFLAIGGFIFTCLLTFAYRSFLWWPLHPMGYPLAVSWNMEWFWFPILISWSAKSIILKYGGVKIHSKTSYFFFGLVLGEFTVGCILNIMGLFMHQWIYVFWH